MPTFYRVSYQTPPEIKTAGFQGHSGTILPNNPNVGQPWPAVSFCAASFAGGLTPNDMRKAIQSFSPPQAIEGKNTPYLYRFNVQAGDFVQRADLPQHVFTNATVLGGSGSEVVITVVVPPNLIEAAWALAPGGWKPVSAF